MQPRRQCNPAGTQPFRTRIRHHRLPFRPKLNLNELESDRVFAFVSAIMPMMAGSYTLPKMATISSTSPDMTTNIVTMLSSGM